MNIDRMDDILVPSRMKEVSPSERIQVRESAGGPGVVVDINYQAQFK